MQVKVKKRALLLGLLLQLAVGFNAAGQVTISPEVGGSYFPYRWGNLGDDINTLDFLLGISGTVPIQAQWCVNVRVAYVFRENLFSEHFGFMPGSKLIVEYIHSDINIDFSVTRKFLDWLHVGIGPSTIRKVNSVHSWKYVSGDGSEDSITYERLDRFNYGFNAILGVQFKGVLLKLEYYRQLKDEYQNIFVGKNRYNAVIAYPIKIKNR